MDDQEAQERRLERARARCDEQPPYSPDWDAAMCAIEDLTGCIERLAASEPFAAA